MNKIPQQLAEGVDRRKANDKNQSNGVKTNDKLLKTIFVIRERAIGVFFIPWCIIIINLILWTCIIRSPKLKDRFAIEPQNGGWNAIYSQLLSTVLAFLLVF